MVYIYTGMELSAGTVNYVQHYSLHIGDKIQKRRLGKYIQSNQIRKSENL